MPDSPPKIGHGGRDRSIRTGKIRTKPTRRASATGAYGEEVDARAGPQEPDPDAQEAPQQHEVGEVRQVDDVGGRPSGSAPAPRRASGSWRGPAARDRLVSGSPPCGARAPRRPPASEAKYVLGSRSTTRRRAGPEAAAWGPHVSCTACAGSCSSPTRTPTPSRRTRTTSSRGRWRPGRAWRRWRRSARDTPPMSREGLLTRAWTWWSSWGATAPSTRWSTAWPGAERTMAALPGGGANIFARGLGMPNDPVEATGWLLDRLDHPPTRIPLGRVDDDRWFVSNCGFGFDAAIVRSVERRQFAKRVAGDAFFVWTALKVFFTGYDRRHASITVSLRRGPRRSDGRACSWPSPRRGTRTPTWATGRCGCVRRFGGTAGST